MNDSQSFQPFREDLRFLSKSFGDGPSPLRPDVGPPRHSSMNTSITYRGYLLKRSNMPFSRPSEPALALPCNSRPVPASSEMTRGLLAPVAVRPQVAEGSDFENSISTSSTLPQDISLINHSRASMIESRNIVVEEPAELRVGKSPVEKGADAAAAFFGMTLSTLDSGTTEVRSKEPPKTVLQVRSRLMTTPSIKVQSNASREHHFKGSIPEPLHRYQSAPTLFLGETNHYGSSLHRSQPPQDVIDPRDGHIWRAKFCVLEDGVLYFYRNKLDGESIEAIRERAQDSVQNNLSSHGKRRKSSNLKDLSKSPMARHLYDYVESCDNAELSGSIWEKRVVLDCVGSVRSAEHEYGANSFELQGVETDETSNPIDSLVLQARDPADMQEWIFQFHRSLASFVRNIMDVFGSSRDYLGIDLCAQPKSVSNRVNLEGYESHSPPSDRGSPGVPLSHGHGRTTVHRRRQASLRAVSSNDDGVLSQSFTLELESSKTPRVNSRLESSPSSGTFDDTHIEGRPSSSLLTPDRKKNSNHSTQQGSLKDNQSNSAQKRKYIPPHLRRKNTSAGIALTADKSNSLSSQIDGMRETEFLGPSLIFPTATEREVQQSLDKVAQHDSKRIANENLTADLPSARFAEHHVPIKRGGCANPDLVVGSILDSCYIPRKASRLEKGPSEAFGGWGGDSAARKSGIYWEAGAVSECGIRDSNEDSFLIVHDLLSSVQLDSAELESCNGESDDFPIVGLFAVFDGHCGNEAARFAAEKLCIFIQLEFLAYSGGTASVEFYEQLKYNDVRILLDKALTKLDLEFCELCQEGGREWESGATALVAVIVNDILVAANLGDCRGVVYQTTFVEDSNIRKKDEWNELDLVFDDHGKTLNDISIRNCTRYLWREIARVHKPSDEDEQQRILEANGWVTNETEIPIGQLRRMDFHDENVIEILRSAKEYKAAPQRILEISRVCGELAVSRALGDRDFKAAFNISTRAGTDNWECPLFLLYPEQHNHLFRGNLIDNRPDFEHVQVGLAGSGEEFLIMASDGLWDVLDVDDAVRVTRDLLFRKQWTAKRTAARLAELAIHLGSSDNVTVIVVRWQTSRTNGVRESCFD